MKKLLLFVALVLTSNHLFAEAIHPANGQTFTLHSNDLQGDVKIVVYSPSAIKKEEPVTVIFYIFGDFLFHPFSGLLSYMTEEVEMIPKAVLVGIDEITDKPIGRHAKEYADFITRQLIDHFKENYTLKDNCVLFGHSRATRLVAQVMQEKPPSIRNFILSAPWFPDPYLGELENSLKEDKRKVSILVTQSEEDLRRNNVKEANEKLLRMLKKYETMVDTKYKYFEGERHMSIPPLSFYYGIKAQLGK